MFIALTLAIVLVVIGIIVAVAFPRRAVSVVLALVIDFLFLPPLLIALAPPFDHASREVLE